MSLYRGGAELPSLTHPVCRAIRSSASPLVSNPAAAPLAPYVRVHCARRKEETVRSHFGGNIAIASTSNKAPGRASWGTPIVVLAGGEALFTYLSRTSR